MVCDHIIDIRSDQIYIRTAKDRGSGRNSCKVKIVRYLLSRKSNPCVGPRMRFIRLLERQLIWADQKALSFFKMVVLIICIEISAAVETEVEQIAFPHRGAERIERRTLLPSAK